jgi:hypothetical protein
MRYLPFGSPAITKTGVDPVHTATCIFLVSGNESSKMPVVMRSLPSCKSEVVFLVILNVPVYSMLIVLSFVGYGNTAAVTPFDRKVTPPANSAEVVTQFKPHSMVHEN